MPTLTAKQAEQRIAELEAEVRRLNPCPPEPAPKDWYVGNLVLSAVKVGRRRSVVIYCDDPQREDPYLLTAAEAGTMAEALVEHARYAREQGDDSWRSDEEAAALIDAIKEPATPEPICGHLLCQRPKGHPGGCSSYRQAADGANR
jgi:hypothetical protein